MGKNLRRKERHPSSEIAEVSWEDRGRHTVKARILDISEEGIRLEMPESLPLRRIASVKNNELGLSANVSVRHCNRMGSKFIVGMEFTGGTRWRPVS